MYSIDKHILLSYLNAAILLMKDLLKVSRFKATICFLLCQLVLLGFAQEKKPSKKPTFSELWRYKLESATDSSTEKSQAITAPALFEKERIFFASKTGFVLALNETDGTKIWEFNANQPISQNLLLADENLFFATEQEIFCLKKEDGELIWRKGLGLEITSPLAYFNGNLFIATSANNIYCLKEQNGEILWEYKTGAPVYAPITISQGILLFGADDGFIYSLHSSNGNLRWQLKIGGKIRSSPLVDNGHIYIGTYDNYLYSIGIKKRKVRWKVRTGADIHASPVSWKDYIFAASFDSYLYCFNRGNGHLHYKIRLPARPYNAPLIIDNIMYIQTLSNKLISIEPETGKELSSFDADSLITSPLSISPDMDIMLIGTNEATLFALTFKPQKKEEILEEEVAAEETGEELEEKREELTEEGKKEILEEEKDEVPKETEEKTATAAIEVPPEVEVIELAIPYDTALYLEAMRRFLLGNYAGAAIGWSEMIAKLNPQYYTIIVGLYCTVDSLKKIYDNKGQGTVFFSLPKPYEGRICYQICLGLFSSAEEAQAKLALLPEFFQQEKPIVTQLSSLLR